MKKLSIFVLILFAFETIFTNFTNVEDNNITLSIDNIPKIGNEYAICNASIASSLDSFAFGGANCGFCRVDASISENSTISHNSLDCTNSAFQNQGHFSGRIENLTTNTLYYIREYLRMDNETIYSEIRQFTTLNENTEEDEEDNVVISLQNVTSTEATIHVNKRDNNL